MQGPLPYYAALIEEAFRRLGIAPKDARTKQPANWVLRRGTAEIAVTLHPGPEKKGLFLRMLSPIVEVTEHNCSQLRQDVLQLNYQLTNAAFSEFEGVIYLVHTQDATLLTPDQAARAFDSFSYFADSLDEQLQEKFKFEKRPPIGFNRDTPAPTVAEEQGGNPIETGSDGTQAPEEGWF